MSVCTVHVHVFFSDTLWVPELTINQENIAWTTDRNTRFRNPPSDDNPSNTSQIDTGSK